MLITTLREKFGKFIVFAIVIAILGFLVQDAFNSRTGFMSGKKDSAGSINGHKVSIQDFNIKNEENTAAYKLNAKNPTMDEATLHQIREKTWEDFVYDQTALVEYKKMGLMLGQDELKSMLYGPNPHPQIVSSFTNPKTGQFDPGQVEQFLSTLDEDNDQISGEEKKLRWYNFFDYIKKERLDGKYKAMISKAVYVPKWLGDFENKNATTVSGKFINIPFSTIADDQVKITDSDLSAYLNKNKKKYEGEASRVVDYVAFDIKPSPEDTAALLKSLLSLKDTFGRATDDSLFVALNSDLPFNTNYLKAKDIKASYADTLFKYPVGSVFGPKLENGNYDLVKIVDRKMIADSVEAKHILLRIKTEKDSARVLALADSISKAITDSTSFAQLAKKYSDDASNKDRGGYLGYMKQGQTVSQFNKFLFNANSGDLKIVTTNFGVHIVKVIKAEKNSDGLKLAIISKELAPSSLTEKEAYAAVSGFSNVANDVATFEKTAQEKGLKIQTSQPIAQNALEVSGLGNAGELIKWAYNAKKDEVSKIITLDDKYLVARMKNIRNKGSVNIDDVREEITAAVKNEKKGEIIKKKILDAKATDINALATQMNTVTLQADGVSFKNPQLGELRDDLFAAAFSGCAQGKMTGPVVGATGVYDGFVEAVQPAAGDVASAVNRLKMQERNKIEYGIFNALNKAAKIEDYRANIF